MLEWFPEKYIFLQSLFRGNPILYVGFLTRILFFESVFNAKVVSKSMAWDVNNLVL